MNDLFKAFRCTTCDTFFSKTGKLERKLVTCSDRVKHIYPENVYELRETLFENLHAFNIPYRFDQKTVQELGTFWLGVHLCRGRLIQANCKYNADQEACTYQVSISCNLIPEPIFLCDANPHHLILSFLTALGGLATQSKTQMKLSFIDVETAIKIKLCAVLKQLNQWRNRAERVSNFVDDCIVEEEEKDLSTKFLQMQKHQLIDLQEHFERYCYVLPVFGFNSAKCDKNLIETYLLPILVNERCIEPTVMKKANQIFSFKFGDIQLLDIMTFLGGDTSFNSFFKAYKTKETKGSSPTNGSIVQRKITTKSFLPMTPSLASCRITTPLRKIITTFEILLTVV